MTNSLTHTEASPAPTTLNGATTPSNTLALLSAYKQLTPSNTLALLSAYKQLTPSERSFVDGYVTHLERDAHKRNDRISNALYRPISRSVMEQSRGLLERPMVKAAITERVNELAANAELSVQRVIKELTTIAFSNLSDYFKINEWGIPEYDFTACTPEQLAALKSWEHIEDVKKGRRVKIVTHDKLKAIEMLAKYMGIVEPENLHFDQSQRRPTAITDKSSVADAADAYAALLG